MSVNRLSSQAVIGLLIVVVGILFLLDTMNIYNTGQVFRWLPSLLILFGLWRLAASRFRNIIGPAIVIVIGAFVQLIVLGIDIGSLWPVILIVVGMFILFGGSWLRNRRNNHDIEEVDSLGILSGKSINVVSKSFKGGQLTAVMGSVEVDLRHAEIDQNPAFIEATSIMGSIEIKVPESWVVKDDTFALMGATEDKRSSSVQVTDDSPDLVITGLVCMGGLKIMD